MYLFVDWFVEFFTMQALCLTDSELDFVTAQKKLSHTQQKFFPFQIAGLEERASQRCRGIFDEVCWWG